MLCEECYGFDKGLTPGLADPLQKIFWLKYEAQECVFEASRGKLYSTDCNSTSVFSDINTRDVGRTREKVENHEPITEHLCQSQTTASISRCTCWFKPVHISLSIIGHRIISLLVTRPYISIQKLISSHFKSLEGPTSRSWLEVR